LEKINLEIGSRLREIRHLFNEGDKLSAKQFAYLLGETTDKILNYENGRASVSINLLINLYNRGINPTYVLTGDGSYFAANSIGQELIKKVEGKVKDKVEILNIKETDGLTIEQMLEMAEKYSVAAGDIMKEINKFKSLSTF